MYLDVSMAGAVQLLGGFGCFIDCCCVVLQYPCCQGSGFHAGSRGQIATSAMWVADVLSWWLMMRVCRMMPCHGSFSDAGLQDLDLMRSLSKRR